MKRANLFTNILVIFLIVGGVFLFVDRSLGQEKKGPPDIVVTALEEASISSPIKPIAEVKKGEVELILSAPLPLFWSRS